MTSENWFSLVPEPVTGLLRLLNQAGYEAWLVGGCVRDMFLGIVPDDYDVATDARPDEVCDLFDRCLETGIDHGTVTVMLPDMSIEVTTYRSEGSYSDGRRPDSVRYENDIKLDLARRDFTINSMAWHPEQGLLDLYGGVVDLQNRILRCVGRAELRLTEDALRQLRAVRFCLTYNLDPDDEMIAAIARYHGGVLSLSTERIIVELSRTGRAQYADKLSAFAGVGLISLIYRKLFNISVDDSIITGFLAGMIQPYWQQNQIWSVLITGGILASHASNVPKLIDGRLSISIEVWFAAVKDIAAYRNRDKITELVRQARLSQAAATSTQAILLFVSYRLMIFRTDLRRFELSCEDVHHDDLRRGRRLKMMLRNIAMLCRISARQVLDLGLQAVEVLHVLISEENFGIELEAEKHLLANWQNFPGELIIKPVQLPIRGNDEAFADIADRRKTGLYLERLISSKIHVSRQQSRDDLLERLSGWLMH